MNYIRHLNTFFSFIKNDEKLTASHVSLYMALFQYWNFNRFQNPFSIYRENIMQLSKLSKNTYHKCVKELHEAKYIYYHPSVSKFQAIRISIIRMDKEEEKPSRYQQLNLFSSPNIETGSVANLIPHSPKMKTDTVANLVHNIKPNYKQERNTPADNFFEGNDRNTKTNSAPVSNLGHMADVMLSHVEAHFQQLNYPNEEAIKFYNHYKSLGWKIQGKTPIEDWKPLVEKWMTNAKRWNSATEQSLSPLGRDLERGSEVQYLYESFLEGKRISHYITAAHFEELKLQLTDEIMQQAWKERINQVAGTNQHSLSQLWQAYLTNDPNNPTVKKDEPNLIALAKRIAVFKHFQQCKQRNIQQLPLPP